MLADPSARPARDPRASLAPALTIVRDAMLANPEMVGGTRDRLDTSLMKAARPDREQGRRWRRCAGSAILPRPARRRRDRRRAGMAIKIEDGDGYDRGTWAASVEALAPGRRARGAGAADAGSLPPAAVLDPHGRLGAEAIAEFELAPVGELVG